MRPSWDEVWMTVALAVADRSLCSRAQIGAVIVSSDNRVEGVCYNGPAPAFDHGGKTCEAWCPRAMGLNKAPDAGYADCVAGHAEANAIARSDWQRLVHATVYATGAMCYGCAKLVGQTGISRVVHVVHDSDAHRDPEAVEKYLRSLGIEVVRYPLQ